MNQDLPHPIRDPVIEAYKAYVDLSLLRESLQLTVEERITRLMDLQRFAEAMRAAGRQATKASGQKATRVSGEQAGR